MFSRGTSSQDPLLSSCSVCVGITDPLSPSSLRAPLEDGSAQQSPHPSLLGNLDFLAISQQEKQGTKALTWNDSGVPWRGRDGDRDVHSGGFVQRGLDHPRHVLLVVGILGLLGHLLQVRAGQGVHRDTPGDTPTATGLQLTLVLPRKKQDLFNKARERFRGHTPDAAPRAGFVFSMEILCRTSPRQQNLGPFPLRPPEPTPNHKI